MDGPDFKVLIRRLPGYEPLVSLRFEMNEGYGELLVGDRRRASPAGAGEVGDANGDQVRAGRFVHVLASGRRRQSYALSRLDDARLQRLPDDQWTELVPITEFGIRYLDMPELGPASSVVSVQVSAQPAVPRTETPPPASPAAAVSVAKPRTTSSASLPPRPTPVTSVVPPSRTPQPPVRSSSSPDSQASMRTTSAGTLGHRDGPTYAAPAGANRVATPLSVESSLGEDAVQNLPIAEARQRLLAEMAKVDLLLRERDDLHEKLEASRLREADLLEILTRWQGRG
jgi:hypothetical protein